MNELYTSNTSAAFWKTLEPIDASVWAQAEQAARSLLPDALRAGNGVGVVADVLSESIFGPDRYRFGALKRLYYGRARAVMPDWARPLLRSVRAPSVTRGKILDWPQEDRYVRFQYAVMEHVLQLSGLESLDIVGFWPADRQFAFVLTHDVEARAGYDHVRELMALEEQYGFRSSFNFVPEGYVVEPDLLAEMRTRGFEIGVHGLNHDGRLFLSESKFRSRAQRINAYLEAWQAVGYRSPMTHRQPEWMQALDIEYDLSFFDTDPFEPMAGGTMSIWPFCVGKFVELPYTLIQDHTYLEVFNHRTPDVWLEKVDFLRRHHGMVLLNAHPDYLIDREHWRVYEEFLAAMREFGDAWNALPREVARWWRARQASSEALPQAGTWRVRIDRGGLSLTPVQALPREETLRLE